VPAYTSAQFISGYLYCLLLRTIAVRSFYYMLALLWITGEDGRASLLTALPAAYSPLVLCHLVNSYLRCAITEQRHSPYAVLR